MPKFELLDGLEKLVPGAHFEGELDNTEESYNSIIWLDPRPKPPYNEVYQAALVVLRRRIADQIDYKTKEIILYRFTYNDINFYMPLDWQFDVLNLFLLRDKLTYPYPLKIGSNEDGSCRCIELKDPTDFENLYNAVFMFIKQTLDEGRKLKDQLPSLSREELENWADPRGPIEYPLEV